MWLVVTGLLTSVPLAMAFDRGLRSQVVGLVTPSASSVALAVGVVVAVCGLAVYLPARRASLLAPSSAIRVSE